MLVAVLAMVTIKKYLCEVLEQFLTPIQERRSIFEEDKGEVLNILKKGTHAAREKSSSHSS